MLRLTNGVGDLRLRIGWLLGKLRCVFAMLVLDNPFAEPVTVAMQTTVHSLHPSNTLSASTPWSSPNRRDMMQMSDAEADV